MKNRKIEGIAEPGESLVSTPGTWVVGPDDSNVIYSKEPSGTAGFIKPNVGPDTLRNGYYALLRRFRDATQEGDTERAKRILQTLGTLETEFPVLLMAP